MASSGSVYSQTLRDITNTKLDELSKVRASFETQRKELDIVGKSDHDGVEKLEKLAQILKTWYSISTSGGQDIRGGSSNSRLEIDLKNLNRFLAQARYDPSVSVKILEQWQRTLLRHADIQSTKFDYASLYGQLTTEWLSNKQASKSETGGGDVDMEDFEHVSGGTKLEYRTKWEESVFEPKLVDKNAINTFLHNLFESTPGDSKHLLNALKEVRRRVEEFERGLASEQSFNQSSLHWTIEGLLASDLLDNEKRDAIRDFLHNPTILAEIADVLNMRMAALQDWTWGDEVLLGKRL